MSGVKINMGESKHKDSYLIQRFFLIAVPHIMFDLGIEKFIYPSSAFPPIAFRDFYRLHIATSRDNKNVNYSFN